MFVVLIGSVAAFLGGIACAVLRLTGVHTAGPVAFALGAIALVGGSTAALGKLTAWGVPGA